MNQPSPLPPPSQLPTPSTPPPLQISSKRSKIWQSWKLWLSVVAGVIVFVAIAAVVWYQFMLSPVDSSGKKQVVEVAQGTTTTEVATVLKTKNLIRNQWAYLLYMRLHRIEPQAGTYMLSPSDGVAKIATQLSSGKQDTFEVTFFPGAMIYDPAKDADLAANPHASDVYAVLRRAGYSDQEVKAALSATYETPLFAGKPAGTTLEGYIFGETYRFDVGTPAKKVLQQSFDTFWEELQAKDLVSKINAQGLTLYQGITLASLVEREAEQDGDRRQVAQVFYSRLQKGMSLGSDVTFIYAAAQANVPAVPTLESPYNTRIHDGLPPGPIAVPSLSSLEAVANPAKGDYLYFIAGDDGTVHFSYTAEEQDTKIAAYCHVLCS